MKTKSVTRGSLLFKEEKIDAETKQRPFLCLKTFSNAAGIVYDYLIVPITSVKTVGDKNLVMIKHPKLKKDSYCKLNNIFTASAEEIVHFDSTDKKFEENVVKRVLSKLLE